jgi:CheY-like chemotaxis protein
MNIPMNISGSHVGAANVLVVDDVEANRAILCRRLGIFGYHYESADSGASALAMVKLSPPDIILLDYMMPVMNGIEVIRELRADPQTKDIPVIMVTARTEGDAVIEALEAGADDYVTKPIDFEVLRVRMETQLEKRDNAKNLRRANAVLDERVSLRAMALADLEEELKEEIRRRTELEARLSEMEGAVATTAADGSIGSEADDLVEIRAVLKDIERVTGNLFTAVTTGKNPNVAQIAELSALVGKAIASLPDS